LGAKFVFLAAEKRRVIPFLGFVPTNAPTKPGVSAASNLPLREL
jgi:hypothetical protein